MTQNMKIKLLTETAKMPTRGSAEAAGWDLYVDKDTETLILPHSTYVFDTGIAIEIPKNNYGAIYARSGLATKSGLRPSNCTGIVDSDFRGRVKIALHNDTDLVQVVLPYERIAQLIICPYTTVNLEPADELDETKRGDSGFGSSGKL